MQGRITVECFRCRIVRRTSYLRYRGRSAGKNQPRSPRISQDRRKGCSMVSNRPTWHMRLMVSIIGIGGMVLAGTSAGRVSAQGPPSLSSNASVFATGLNAPRGLRFGPDGGLYVAEAGLGGTTILPSRARTSFGPCMPAGPEVVSGGSGYTGRISRVNATGQRTTVVDSLPSDNTFGSVVGPADVEFLNGVLYGLLDSGCDFGNNDVPGGIIQVANDGSWSIYDLSTFAQNHPPAQPDAADFAPDGTWYGMTQGGGKLYTVNPNGGQVVELTPNTATFREVADISASQGHVVPTAIAYQNGALYVATLGTFPSQQGGQKVYKITPDGTMSVYATGLTAVVGLAFNATGQLYALETFTGAPVPGPSAAGTGMVVRVATTGSPTTVVSGLTFPTAMTFAPDGSLYISNIGYGVPGAGQIVKATVPAGP
jgi:hypothetical protein